MGMTREGYDLSRRSLCESLTCILFIITLSACPPVWTVRPDRTIVTLSEVEGYIPHPLSPPDIGLAGRGHICGADRDRTDNLRRARAALS